LKHPKCIVCGQLADWLYTGDLEKGYCEDCVPRGCSCMWDEEINDYVRDGLGRILPCADFTPYEEGEGIFDI
jgi:hypothetical protein